MNEEEQSKMIEQLDELQELWKEKQKLIKKESKKRMYCMAFVIIFDISAVILQLLGIINFVGSLTVVGTCLVLSLAYNRYIGKKIQKIIWIDDIKELQTEFDV